MFCSFPVNLSLPWAEYHELAPACHTNKEEQTLESKLSSFVPLVRDSRGIQTHNLLIRSQMLYSVELGSLPCCFCGCKGMTIFSFRQINHQLFCKIFCSPNNKAD